jgi:signal recognition particle subunit SRP54
MGSVGDVLGMIPGARSAQADARGVDREIRRSEAIIRSMTPAERASPKVINGSRRRRVARGSGTSVQDVSGLLRQFDQVRNMMQSLSQGKALPGFPGLPGMPGLGLPGGMPRSRAGGKRTATRTRTTRKRPRTPKKLQKKKKRKR